MKAAFFRAGGALELRELERPVPRYGEVVVKVGACGICGSDLHVFHRDYPPPAVCPGHEVSGEVVATGDGAATRVGERVTLEPRFVCGQCWCCRTGNFHLCPTFRPLGGREHGGFAEFVRIPEAALVPLPAAVDDALGALTEPLAVALHGVRLAQVHIGSRVLVLGAGTIGLLCVAAACAAGATDVWITARHPHQQQAAEALGGTRIFRGLLAAHDLLGAAQASPVDVVLETVGGNADTVDEAVGVVRPGGTIILLGVFTSKPSFDAMALLMKEIHLIGSMTYNQPGPRSDFELAVEMLGRHPERFRPLITHRFPLDQITRGFETAADKGCGSIKVVIEPQPSARAPVRRVAQRDKGVAVH